MGNLTPAGRTVCWIDCPCTCCEQYNMRILDRQKSTGMILLVCDDCELVWREGRPPPKYASVDAVSPALADDLALATPDQCDRSKWRKGYRVQCDYTSPTYDHPLGADGSPGA